MIRARVGSSDACSETARLIGRPSLPSASIPGTTPHVEMVNRRGLMPNSSGSIRERTDARVTKRPRQIGQFFEPALGAMRCVPTDLLRPVRRLPVLVEPDDKLVPRQLAYGGTTLGHRLERNGAIQDGTRSSARMSRSPRLHSAPVIARLPAGFPSLRRTHPAAAG